MIDAVYVELQREIRELALTMVRFEQRSKEAAECNRWYRVAEYDAQRNLVRERRSALLREVWLARQRMTP